MTDFPNWNRWPAALLALTIVGCPAADSNDDTNTSAQTTEGNESDSTAVGTSSGSGMSTSADGSSESGGSSGATDDSGSTTMADSSTGDVACGDPAALGSFTPNDGGARGFAVVGDTVYLAAEGGGLVIVDISDPGTPTEQGVLDFGPGLLAQRVAAGPEGIVFVAMRGSGWVAVDVSDPAMPDLAELEDTTAAQDLVWADDVLYVADVNGVQTFDVTDPAAPVPLDIDNVLPGSTQSVEIAGGYAFAAGLGAGLSVVDIADPSALTEVVTTDHDGRGYLTVAGDRAFLSATDGVYILDITDPTQPVELGVYAGEHLDAVAVGDRLWVLGRDTSGTDNPSLAAIDITDPALPVVTGTLDDYARPSWIEVAEGRVLFTEENDDALHVLDGCPG